MLNVKTRIRQLLECLVSWILPKEDLADDKSSLTDKNLNGCMRVGITNYIPNYTSPLGGAALS
jgi:hypothetical protein